MPSLPYSIEALVFGRERSIAGIVPDVVISETHSDEVVVTEYPVDSGSPMADHAYKKPADLTLSFGWSDSSTLLNSVLSGSIFKGVRTTKDIYEKFLELMNARQRINVSTGKRKYKNMLIVSLRTTSTVETESALILEIGLREVLTTEAQTVSLRPEKTANASRSTAVTDGGSRSVTNATV